jgi:hypothetical protein
MNLDLEKIFKDKSNRKHYIAQGTGAVIGGFIGGYPGMMIGMSIGGYLFKPDEAKKKQYSNYDIQLRTSRLDSVPHVIGTDMCAGKVIFFNNRVFAYYDQSHIPKMANSTSKDKWQKFINSVSKAGMPARNVEYAVNFSGKYNANQHIGVVHINDIPFWFWVLLSDMFENHDDALNPDPPLAILDASQFGEQSGRIDIEELIGTPIEKNTIMYYQGYFADFTGLSTAPSTSNLPSLSQLGFLNPSNTVGMPLEQMPKFTAEMNSDRVWLSPESHKGGDGMPNSGKHYFETESRYDLDNYSIVMSRYWGCRDAKNNCFVGMENGDYAPIYMEGSDRNWTYAGNDATLPAIGSPQTAIRDWFKANICPDINYSEFGYTRSPAFLQATDVNDNRVYICVHRHWWNPNQGRGVYGLDKWDHHHAEYGVEFDIFYFDRSDPDYKVQSLIYNQRYNLPDPEGGITADAPANPAIELDSMVVSEDHVYLFGSRVQTDVLLSDYRTIESGDNSYTKIYADFSQYPDGWWEGKYAALGQNDYKIWREITEQTSTYIVVAKEFAALPTAGEVVQLCKYPKWVADWGIVGEGSTTTKLICNSPTWNSDGWLDSSYSGHTYWDKVFFIGQWLYGVGASNPGDGTEINLSSPLDREPIPGERICFTMDSSTDFDENDTNPNFSSDYVGIFFDDLGFDNPTKADLGNLNASRIDSNEFNRSHHVCLKIDKSTGAIEVHDTQRLTTPTYYVGPALTWTGDVVVYACATDVQAFVYSHESQYGTQMAVYSYLLDFDDGEIHEQIHRRNEYSGGHAPAWCYMGCVSAKEWDGVLQQYVDVWYTVLRVYDSYGSLNDAVDPGTYFLRLGEGHFSNKQVWSDLTVLGGYHGLDLNRKSISILLFRKQIATGPLYVDTYTNSYPDENDYQIGKFGITEDIYFYVEKVAGLGGTGISSGPFEMWRFTIPTEQNAAGELYCIAKSHLWDAETDLTFDWLEIPSVGNFRMCRYGWYASTLTQYNSGVWYQCDESPPQIIEDLLGMTEPRYIHGYIDESLFNFDEALEICNEIIDATIYTPKEEIDLRERRFQFSKNYDSPIKFVDALKEVLDTCQGFLSICHHRTYYNIYTTERVSDPDEYESWELFSKVDDYKMIVPNKDETPVHYFGLDKAVFVSTQLSDENNLIYGDFSAYPNNYWKGDFVYYGETKDHLLTSSFAPEAPPKYRNWDVIIKQTSTYIEIGGGLASFFPASESFTLRKDNIKEGSFTFAEKSEIDRPNKVRIEFKNRLNKYMKEVAEAEDTYRLEILGELEKIDFYQMHGIKRATQASRMATRILDQWNYQKYICGFETDLLGYSLCMGDIIGVSHDITGWNGKWFRIVSMEELIDFEVKFELEEFNPYCYHDYGVPIFQGFPYTGFPKPYVPLHVERFEIKEDIEFNRLYFTFKKSDFDGGFFVGARIYREVGDTYEYIDIINQTVSSVKLSQSVGLNDTTIYYDNDTLSGSFPAQGVIWIGNELMYYHGIDTTNYAFTNVVRGYKETDQVEHLIDEENDELNVYIILKDDATLYYEIPESWVGTTQTFKASAFTVHNNTVPLDLSPSFTIDIVGYGVLPYFPESIQNALPGTENIFETLGLEEVTKELSIEEVIEILGLGTSETITETLTFLIESLGLGDSLKDVSIINIVESLGLGDVKYQPDYASIIEAIGLGDSKTVIETLAHLTETLGLGDFVEIIEVITETLGLGDSNIIVETLAQLVEAIGLGDIKTVSETWTQFIETLGLGDSNYVLTEESITETLGLGDVTIVEVTEYIVESLGLGDSKEVTETLAQIFESLGLGDSVSDEIVSTGDGLALESSGSLLLESSGKLLLETQESLEEQMMILNNNML